MFGMTSFLLKQLYELMADDADSTDFEPILLFLANNQLPDLICETFIEMLTISVVLAFIWIFVAISDINSVTDGSHCKLISTFACPTKSIMSDY